MAVGAIIESDMKNTSRIVVVLLTVALLLPGCAASLNKAAEKYFGNVFSDLIVGQGIGFVLAIEMTTLGTAINFGQQDRFEFPAPIEEIKEKLKLNESLKVRNTFEYFRMNIDSINIDYFANDTLVAEGRIVDINMRNVESILIENGSFFGSCLHFKMEYYFGSKFKGEGDISISKPDSEITQFISKDEKNVQISQDTTISYVKEKMEDGFEEEECPYVFKVLYERIDLDPKSMSRAIVKSYLSMEFVKSVSDTLQTANDILSITYNLDESEHLIDSADKNLVELLENLDNDVIPSGNPAVGGTDGAEAE